MDRKTGKLRARGPSVNGAARQSRTFPPGARDEASAWLDAFLAPQPAPAQTIVLTVEQWAVDWWTAYVEAIKPYNTARTYLSHLRKLAPKYSALVTSVTTTDLQTILGSYKGRVAPSTLIAIARVWRACFEAAVEDELIGRNPARRLALPSAPKRKASRHLTAREVALLREAIVGHRFEAAYALMLGCGLRIGEILGLSWESVDLPGRRLWIQEQFTGGRWRDEPKGRNPHHVPLPSWVAATLARCRRSQPVEYTLVLQSPWQGPRARKNGRPSPWSGNPIRQDLEKIITALGLERAVPHAARHGLASYLMQGGVAPPVIAERLGNSPEIILRTYGHPTDEGRQQADALVEAYLSEPAADDVSGAKSG